MAVEKQVTTIEEFLEFVYRPENADREFEFINGEIIEKMGGRASNSAIAAWIAFYIRLFCRERTIPCYLSGEHGSYRVMSHIFEPDVAYRTTPFTGDYPEPEPPLWVVEVVSPTDKPHEIRAKRMIYLSTGILYWELYPEDKSVDVYAPGQPPKTLGMNDTLDGGDVLPGFILAVKDIFTDV